MHQLKKRIVALCFVALAPTLAHADSPVDRSLAGTLHALGRTAISHCQNNQIESVGVLKFLVVKDGEDFSDDVGTINSLLAKRMEVALVLANAPRDPITLIEDASATANQIEDANHLSKDGRAKLLRGQYHTMWGDQTIEPDALLTGIASISDDLNSITISLLIFTKSSNELTPVGRDLVATMSASLLSEVGESFTTRGAFDGGKVLSTSGDSPTSIPADLPGDIDGDIASDIDGPSADAELLASAKRVRDGDGTIHPLKHPASPVKLQVFYDGVAVPFDVVGGVAKLREPRSGQRVQFLITKDQTPSKYSVVLKVNGQNTLNKQTLPDHQCRKFLLRRPGESLMVRGYQITNSEIESFRVLGRAESKSREVDYGEEVGTVSITVFPEGSAPKLELDEDKHETTLIEKSTLPKEPSSSFGALKAKLLSDANRGLIAEGNRVANSVEVVKFFSDPTPIMTATANYYTPN